MKNLLQAYRIKKEAELDLIRTQEDAKWHSHVAFIHELEAKERDKRLTKKRVNAILRVFSDRNNADR